MENQIELKDALANLKNGIETKTAEQITQGLTALETKTTQEIKTYQAEVISLKEAHDKLIEDFDKKMLEARSVGNVEMKDVIADIIVDNFQAIQRFEKSITFESKTVGNMTLVSNLTGDAPRIYRNDVTMKPGDPVNVSDLVRTIEIEGGVYTYPVETTSEGSITSDCTENIDKTQIDYDIVMQDCNTCFLAGFAVFSRKMQNNLPFLKNFLPAALRRDYWKAENRNFFAKIVALATASTQTSGNNIERIINDQAVLLGLGYFPNAIVVNPADYAKILTTNNGAGSCYCLPGAVELNNGVLVCNGLRIIPVAWVPINKYALGDWSYAEKVVSESLNVRFFEQDSDNVRKNNITARVEAQVCFAIYRPDAFIYGDFTNIT